MLGKDIAYIKESIEKIEGHLEKLNGTVLQNSMDIQKMDDSLDNHLQKHVYERDSKFKWVAVVTSIGGIIISIMYFLKP
jgi:hypothetical protein